MKIIIKIAAFYLLLVSFSLQAEANSNFLKQPEVQAFVRHMVKAHHFDAKQLNQWMAKATFQPSIIEAISKPAEKLSWAKYQDLFITPARIQEGAEFWKTHQTTLRKAEKKYGVPAEIIIAIIGVETFYGKRTGQYSVLDSLTTLAFHYPPRAKFFLEELEHFLLLAREEKWDPTQIKGSYAGAMGNPQFVSSSYRHFAVDFNQNGKRDLLSNLDDSIGSVANYFKIHGWKTDEIIVIPVHTHGNKFTHMIASKGNPKPNYSLAELQRQGISLSKNKSLKTNQQFALVALEGKQGMEYWLGAQNFYVITRYNHSDHYAMAVYTLSQKIKSAYYKHI